MTERLNVSEQGYRGLKLPSYSLLKRLDEEGPRSLLSEKKFDSEPMDFGSLTDCLLFQPEEQDNLFYFEAVEKPTAQTKELADYIVENYSGIPDKEEILAKTYEIGIYGRKLDEARINTFNNKVFWEYLEAKFNSAGKTVFSPSTLQGAKEAVHLMKTDPKTKDILNIDDADSFNQLKLLSTYCGTDVKAMLDRVTIDHENKVVRPYDLKCISQKLKSFRATFEKMRYYLQGALYRNALIWWVEENYPEYEVEDFRFIVYSRADRAVGIFRMRDEWYTRGQFGYIDSNGNFRKGYKQLLEDYNFYIENDSYTTEREFIVNEEVDI